MRIEDGLSQSQKNLENKESSQVESLAENVDLDIEDFAAEKESELEKMGDDLIRGGDERLRNIGDNVGFSAEEKSEIGKKMNIAEKLSEIVQKTKDLIKETKLKISKIISPDQEDIQKEGDQKIEKKQLKNTSEENNKQGNCGNCGKVINFAVGKICTDCGHKFGVDVFDPEEQLAKIKKIPNKEKGEKIKQFKEQLVSQKIELMNIRNTLLDAVKESPDASVDDLVESVSGLSDKAKLTTEQKNLVKKAVEIYKQKNETVKNILDQCKNPETKEIDVVKLFDLTFNFKPAGNFAVKRLGNVIKFEVENEDDYAKIQSQSFLEGRSPNETEIRNAKSSGGVQLGKVAFPGLEGIVIVENASLFGGIGKNKERSSQILRHEANHAFNSILREAFFAEGNEFGKKIHTLEVDSPEYERQRKNLQIESAIKDEISAYFVDGTSVSKIREILLRENGLYNYGLEHASDSEGEHTGFSKQYIDIVDRGITAFDNLVRSGYSREEAQALLFNEPLRYWGRTAERITGKKGSYFDEERAAAIRGVSSLDELRVVLCQFPVIQNSADTEKKFSANELMDAINYFINKAKTDQSMQRRILDGTFISFASEYGIQKKVIELLKK